MRAKPYEYIRDANVIKRTWIRQRRARQFGARFFYGPYFRPPRTLAGAQRISLRYPAEKGMKYAFIEIFLDDVYGLGSLEAPCARILDIGANVGFFSVYARTLFPQALIHAYEPNAALAPFLRHQATPNAIDVFLEAVGKDRGTVRLECGSESVMARSAADAGGAIPQVSFAEAVRRLGGSVDLVKLDCEGAEWQIIEDKEAWRHVRRLAMEYHLFEPGQSHPLMVGLVAAAGFAITFHKEFHNGGFIHAEQRSAVSGQH